MKIFKSLIGFFILTVTLNASGQDNCSFKIDTAKILANINLDTLLSEFQIESFKVSTDKKDMPHFIKKQLNCLTHGFSIANPGQLYQNTDVIVQKLPSRQLIFLAKSKNMFVMTYQMGVMGLPRKILIIKIKDKTIIDFWSGQGFEDLDTKRHIVDYLKQNLNTKKLNTNMIYF